MITKKYGVQWGTKKKTLNLYTYHCVAWYGFNNIFLIIRRAITCFQQAGRNHFTIPATACLRAKLQRLWRKIPRSKTITGPEGYSMSTPEMCITACHGCFLLNCGGRKWWDIWKSWNFERHSPYRFPCRSDQKFRGGHHQKRGAVWIMMLRGPKICNETPTTLKIHIWGYFLV